MTRNLALSITLATVLSGCGVMNQHYEGQSSNDIPDGPGMLSGEDGAFVIYSDEKHLKGDSPPAANTKADDTESRRAPPSNGPASSDSTSVPANAAEYREFQDYQAFLRWKRSARGTEEYREFQDWRKWRDYKLWEKHHSQ